MNIIANHFVRGGDDVSAAPYEYKECGLQGIFLHNGYDVVEHDGEKSVSVFDTVGLHQCIGEHLVLKRKELAPEEIRFLRKTLDLTQSELGALISQSSQQVARWEKGQCQMPGPADRCLRGIFLLKSMAPEERHAFMDVLKSIDDMDDLTPRRIQLHLNGEEWEDHRRAA